MCVLLCYVLEVIDMGMHREETIHENITGISYTMAMVQSRHYMLEAQPGGWMTPYYILLLVRVRLSLWGQFR